MNQHNNDPHIFFSCLNCFGSRYMLVYRQRISLAAFLSAMSDRRVAKKVHGVNFFLVPCQECHGSEK